jgi:hypothetical protein
MASGAGVLTPKRCCPDDLGRQVAKNPDDYGAKEYCFSQVPIAQSKEMGKVWHTRTSTDFSARSFPSDSTGQPRRKLLLFQSFWRSGAFHWEWDRKDKTGDEIRKIGNRPFCKLHFGPRRPIAIARRILSCPTRPGPPHEVRASITA